MTQTVEQKGHLLLSLNVVLETHPEFIKLAVNTSQSCMQFSQFLTYTHLPIF